MGPKGHSLQRLQEETLCRILIQGRGSKRDPNKEKELLATNDPKYKYIYFYFEMFTNIHVCCYLILIIIIIIY